MTALSVEKISKSESNFIVRFLNGYAWCTLGAHASKAYQRLFLLTLSHSRTGSRTKNRSHQNFCYFTSKDSLRSDIRYVNCFHVKRIRVMWEVYARAADRKVWHYKATNQAFSRLAFHPTTMKIICGVQSVCPLFLGGGERLAKWSAFDTV